jgi:hypothetical protein
VVSLLGALIPAPHTVSHRGQLPDDGEGARWADAVEVTGCRVEVASKRTETPEGRVVTLTAMILMPAKPHVESGDKLDLGDGKGERVVHRVQAPVWLNGERMHHEVWVA